MRALAVSLVDRMALDQANSLFWAAGIVIFRATLVLFCTHCSLRLTIILPVEIHRSTAQLIQSAGRFRSFTRILSQASESSSQVSQALSKHYHLVLLLTTVLAQALLPRTATGQQTHQSLFELERIVPIEIRLKKSDWDSLRKQSRDPGKAFMGFQEDPFTWFKASATVDGQKVDSVEIRKKGFIGSLDDNFPSLKIKLDSGKQRSPIEGINLLTLNNNKQDNSLLSQLLAYDLFNAVGVHAPRCNFVRLSVNGVDLGLYCNVETIGKPFLQRRFGNQDGFLLEGTLADFYPKSLNRLELKGPAEAKIPEKIELLAKLLASDDQSVDLEQLEKLIDLDNFLRFWVVESIIGFWDGYCNNQNNFWVYENSANGKLYFMPWGADGAFMGGGFPGMPAQGPASVYAESMLANRLFNHPSVNQKYVETMRWVLADVWKEDDLVEKIDRMEKLLMEDPHQRQKGATQAMRQARRFIRGRREAIEKELDKWPVTVASKPRRPMYSVPVGTMSGSFKAFWLDSAPRAADPKGQLDLQYNLHDKTIQTKNAAAYAHPSPGRQFFGPPMPTVPSADLNFEFVQASDDKPKTITLRVRLDDLANSKGKPILVQGMFNDADQGDGQRFGPFGGGGKTFEGTLELSEASTKKGEPVAGRFELQLNELRGGFMDRFRQPRQ